MKLWRLQSERGGGVYIEKRRRLYYAVHEIPESLRPAFQRKRFVACLGTANIEEARLLAAQKEHEWRFLIKETRARIKAEGWDNDESSMSFYIGALSMSENLPIYEPHVEKVLFDAWLEQWVQTQRAVGKAEKSIFMAVSTIRKFSEEFDIESIVRGNVQKWVDARIVSGVSVATIRRNLTELRTYWKYLRSLHVVGDSVAPFSDLTIPKKIAQPDDDRRPFPIDAIAPLVNGALGRGDVLLADAIRIAAFTGARIEEICSIRVYEVFANHIVINGTKTMSSRRVLPIHPMLASTLDRMISAAKLHDSTYIFMGLKSDKFDDRSAAMSKRFGRLRSSLGYGREYVFHSIRKTFANTIQNLTGREILVQQMLGRRVDSVTGRHYTTEPSIEAMEDAMRGLLYPGYVPG